VQEWDEVLFHGSQGLDLLEELWGGRWRVGGALLGRGLGGFLG